MTVPEARSRAWMFLFGLALFAVAVVLSAHKLGWL